MAEKHKCEGRIIGDWGRSRQCEKTGAHEHNGKHYCKLHHPPTVKAKRQAQSEKWNKEWEEKAAADAKAKAEAAEQQRRAECFPDLLEALQMLYSETLDYIRLNNLGGEDNQCMRLARAALTRATGEPS